MVFIEREEDDLTLGNSDKAEVWESSSVCGEEK